MTCRHVALKRTKAKGSNKLSCGVTQRYRSYCTFCFAVISNVAFFRKTYTKNNPFSVRQLKDS